MPSSLPKEICGVIETSKARFDNPQLLVQDKKLQK
jgi:hypothetical protein